MPDEDLIVAKEDVEPPKEEDEAVFCCDAEVGVADFDDEAEGVLELVAVAAVFALLDAHVDEEAGW